MCRKCYDVAWQIVFSDLWKKNIFELVGHKKSRSRAYVSLMMPCDKIFSYPIKIWISQEFWNWIEKFNNKKMHKRFGQ